MRSISDPFEGAERILTRSVADLAYERIRGLVLSGELAPGTRLGQVELAERLGISRTPVREALRRLGGEGLVEGHSHRGFRVSDLGLDAVLRRLEVRAILEPGIAAHDASRSFHLALARASGNEELVRVIESLWLVEVGRRLLFRRSEEPDWQLTDASEHREVLAAVHECRAADAEHLMAGHVRRAVHHWEPERHGSGETKDR